MISFGRRTLCRHLLLFLCACLSTTIIESFQVSPAQHSTNRMSQSTHQRRPLLFALAASSNPIAVNTETQFSHQDKNGKDISVDSIVRVAASGLKAYQVNKAGFGSYNDKKEFVYNSQSMYLIIPEGLRGKVTRVYDEDVIGANYPILVKFIPGELIDEGYDVPFAFTMHFLPDEIECV